MYTSILFKESPLLGGVFLLAPIILYKNKQSCHIIALFIIIFMFLLCFYRYKPHKTEFNDNIIISPAEGKITGITIKDKIIHVSIYMNIFNNHTQIYPINGTVIKRIYDQTGKFNIVIDRDKCRENEKKIHTILSNDGKIVTVTQIAGFLPRRITSSNLTPENIKAGQYLGMIKFGSRIDIAFPGDISMLKVKLYENIGIGDLIYEL
jgi:phosphatidylserine decarboxylase